MWPHFLKPLYAHINMMRMSSHRIAQKASGVTCDPRTTTILWRCWWQKSRVINNFSSVNVSHVAFLHFMLLPHINRSSWCSGDSHTICACKICFALAIPLICGYCSSLSLWESVYSGSIWYKFCECNREKPCVHFHSKETTQKPLTQR